LTLDTANPPASISLMNNSSRGIISTYEPQKLRIVIGLRVQVSKATQVLLAADDVGRDHHPGNGKHVRANQRPETSIPHASGRTRSIDPDFGRGGGKPDESATRGSAS
jgi:hypothetical protein